MNNVGVDPFKYEGTSLPKYLDKTESAVLNYCKKHRIGYKMVEAEGMRHYSLGSLISFETGGHLHLSDSVSPPYSGGILKTSNIKRRDYYMPSEYIVGRDSNLTFAREDLTGFNWEPHSGCTIVLNRDTEDQDEDFYGYVDEDDIELEDDEEIEMPKPTRLQLLFNKAKFYLRVKAGYYLRKLNYFETRRLHQKQLERQAAQARKKEEDRKRREKEEQELLVLAGICEQD